MFVQTDSGDMVCYMNVNGVDNYVYYPTSFEGPAFKANTLHDALLFCDDPLIAAELERKMIEALSTSTNTVTHHNGQPIYRGYLEPEDWFK